jgi:V-type H+-transporting ATPase proteolipid subunit
MSTLPTTWSDVFYSINPYTWANVGVGLALGLSILGAAWYDFIFLFSLIRGIFLTGSSLLSASVKTPRITSKNLVSVIFCEAVAIYGVIMGIIMVGKMTNKDFSSEKLYNEALFSAYNLFSVGLSVGLSNLFCG